MGRKAKSVPFLARHRIPRSPTAPATEKNIDAAMAALQRRYGPQFIDRAKQQMRDRLQYAGAPMESWRKLQKWLGDNGHGVGSELFYAA